MTQEEKTWLAKYIRESSAHREARKITRGLSVEQLTQVYYQIFNYDSRLPDLFALIPEKKLKNYLYYSFAERCTNAELKDAVSRTKKT